MGFKNKNKKLLFFAMVPAYKRASTSICGDFKASQPNQSKNIGTFFCNLGRMAIKLVIGWRSVQRWKSQRIKNRLGHKFSIDFLIHILGYGFLLEIRKIWQKSRDFWVTDFFLEVFKIHRLVLFGT